MLEEINIKNLGVIQEANLTFTPGLTCITGETGAGKTMVLTALGLLLGRRSDSTMIRNGATFASVEGVFQTNNNIMVETIVSDAGGDVEEGQLLVNRTVNSDGKSKASAGGKNVPASTLNSIGELLVNIHGQADQVKLRSPNAQREALDSYNSDMMQPIMKAYKDAYADWKKASEELTDISANMVARQLEYESLAKAVNDISEVSPVQGEDVTLKNNIDRLSHLETLREATAIAVNKLSTDDYDAQDALSLVSEVVKVLGTVSEYDNDVALMLDKAESIKTDMAELSNELAVYLNSIDMDSLEELNQTHERLSSINMLMRKYGPSLDDVLVFFEEATNKVNYLNPESMNVEMLEKKVHALGAVLAEKATSLTNARLENSEEITSRINEELAGLGMGGASIIITVTPNGSYASHGADDVAFLMKVHAKGEPLPVSKSSSGGELSRIMLALELVLADPDNVSTFIFDEVDSGVGGATAIEIGKRLTQLAEHAQVIVVTHLPQVAVFADNHLRVLKTSGEEFVSTDVSVLKGDGQVNEIARMLSGLGDSETGLAHAREMLELAAEFKTNL